MSRPFFVALVLVFSASTTSDAQETPEGGSDPAIPRTSWGVPDLRGVWDFRSATPLERPDQFANQTHFTEEQARYIEANAEDLRWELFAMFGATGADFELWGDTGDELTPDRRTSLIVDPADGKIPFTPEGQKLRMEVLSSVFSDHIATGPEDRGLSERCILWTPTPLHPQYSNNNLQIFQTPDQVALLHEMIHDVRFVPLDGRPHLPDHLRQLRGDSRGRWEGDTLVVETKSFRDAVRVDPMTTSETRLTERFRLLDADALEYEYTIENPRLYERPWTVRLPMKRNPEPLYEYACHEGNRSMVNILVAARLADEESAGSEEPDR